MKTPLILICLALTIAGAQAQTSIAGRAGFGYLEHFSAGITLSVKQKTSLSFLYGSNFFSETEDFSTFYFQYDRSLPSLTVGKITPVAGIKIGRSVFSDSFYRWKVISAVPFAGAAYKFNTLVNIGFEAGLAISRIESVTRINYGEIGKYKQYLPELKIFLQYKIIKLSGA